MVIKEPNNSINKMTTTKTIEMFYDEYECDFTQRRAIIWTLSFTLKLNFYGPINRQAIIRTATVNTFNQPDLTEKQHTYTATISPDSGVPGDNVSIIDSFTDF